MEINDVLHEIDIIKQVLEHRSTVWEVMHGISAKGKENSNQNQSQTECKWVDDCDPVDFRDTSCEGTERIEKYAHIVQNKVRPGSLYNILNSSESK